MACKTKHCALQAWLAKFSPFYFFFFFYSEGMTKFTGQVYLYGESAVGCVMSIFSPLKASDTETSLFFLTSFIFC